MPHSRVTFIAVCLANILASSQANALSSTQVYGLVDLSIYSQQLSGQTRVAAIANGNMTTSFIGVRGGEDLGDGLKASFAFEGFFRADTGESGRGNTDTFFQRQSWVGVSDDRLGTLRLGRLPTPNWLTTIKFGPFGGASVTPFVMHTYLPSALQPMMTGSGASDASWANSIGYISPRWSGFTGMAVYALSEGSANGKRLGASLGYDAGPLAASIAFEKLSQMSLPFGAPVAPLITAARPSFAATDDSTVQAAISYDFTLLKLFGQLAQTKLQNAGSSEIKLVTSQFGVSAPVGAGKVMVSWAHTKKQQTATDDLRRDTLSVGYDYNLSKHTDIYAVYLNDKVTNLNRGNGLAVGLRHTF
ncbi:porin [Undibacterium arcticum]|uniref:Porin n=1 Tax=Undibacterium arcticum TaxID=1762892 RepID=A0ABV7EVM1_9BURK